MCASEFLLSSCEQRSANAQPPRGEPSSSKFEVRPQPTAVSSAELEKDDLDQRRTYGAVDMRFQPCVTRQDGQVLVGNACPSGIIVYGPYVPVPAESGVEVTFEIQANERIEVYGDIVSQMGKRALAGLGPEIIEAGTKRKLSYRVRMFNSDKNLEARVGITSEHPVHFQITNMTVTVN